jgi:threonine aldolase
MKRKIMGGGMRQAGILAAAGIVALTSQVSPLAEDHRRAKKLAEGLAAIPGVGAKPEETDINMVFAGFPPAEDQNTADKIINTFKQYQIRINPPEGGVFRFCTHYWIGDGEVEIILKAAREAFCL